MTSKATTVTAYLKELPADRKSAIAKLRTLIKKTAPDVKEAMEYGLPMYSMNGPLFALASQKRYLALYVAETDLVKTHKPRLGKVNVGKSCIRFKKLEDLSLEAVAALLDETAARRRQQGGRKA